MSVIVLPFDSIGDGTGTVGPDFVNGPNDAGEQQAADQQLRPAQRAPSVTADHRKLRVSRRMSRLQP
ncbi:hypothetical protein [Sinorhizobium sp. NFACC03]|uniref:hypothetical protein n=1 Tax=Sinorhizobium sp. NFACC03 TaxID=1566295 RepID=UPI00159FF4D5|nr:hypothetical protein [Sinorhizobium sp. NFACC03]